MSENFADSVMDELTRRTIAMVDNMTEQVNEKIDDAMDRYYDSYSPKYYCRTDKMRNSIYRTKARVVYPYVESEIGVSLWESRYSMTYTVFDAIRHADMYTHGGYYVEDAQVSVWHDPINYVEKNQKRMWEKAAEAAGIGR